MVISEIWTIAREELGERDAQLLLCDILSKSSLELVLDKNRELSERDRQRITDCINRIKNHEPLQYVVGSCEFMSLPFSVTPATLIPRADTETLVEYIIDNAPPSPAILDIGTGSGCIAISLAHYIKGSKVSAMDISEAALKIARENAEANKVNVSFIHHDIMKKTEGRYDIIVSNPPYIETDVIKTLDKNVRDFEPYSALDGGADGLCFYRRIVSLAPFMLNPGGMLAFEVGHTQADRVAELMRDNFQTKIIPDLCGINRVVAGTLIRKD